jgi:excisionase family DNA binding protein
MSELSLRVDGTASPEAARHPRGLTRADLMTAAQVAELLDVPVSTVREWGRRGILPRVKLGRHVRFVRAQVEATVLASRDPHRREYRSGAGRVERNSNVLEQDLQTHRSTTARDPCRSQKRRAPSSNALHQQGANASRPTACYQVIVIVWVRKPNGTVRSTAFWTRLRAWPTPWALASWWAVSIVQRLS